MPHHCSPLEILPKSSLWTKNVTDHSSNALLIHSGLKMKNSAKNYFEKSSIFDIFKKKIFYFNFNFNQIALFPRIFNSLCHAVFLNRKVVGLSQQTKKSVKWGETRQKNIFFYIAAAAFNMCILAFSILKIQYEKFFRDWNQWLKKDYNQHLIKWKTRVILVFFKFFYIVSQNPTKKWENQIWIFSPSFEKNRQE